MTVQLSCIFISFCNTSFSFHFTHVKAWGQHGQKWFAKTAVQQTIPLLENSQEDTKNDLSERKGGLTHQKLQNWCDGTRKQSATHSVADCGQIASSLTTLTWKKITKKQFDSSKRQSGAVEHINTVRFITTGWYKKRTVYFCSAPFIT